MYGRRNATRVQPIRVQPRIREIMSGWKPPYTDAPRAVAMGRESSHALFPAHRASAGPIGTNTGKVLPGRQPGGLRDWNSYEHHAKGLYCYPELERWGYYHPLPRGLEEIRLPGLGVRGCR